MKSPDLNSKRSKRKLNREVQVNSPDFSGRIHKRAEKRQLISRTHSGPSQGTFTLQSGEELIRVYNNQVCNAGGAYRYY